MDSSVDKLYLLVCKLWESKNVTNSSELEAAINGKVINLAYHSNKIENDNVTYNDTREIFERDGVTSYTGDLRTLFEIRNSKDAMENFYNAFDRKIAMSHDFVKEIQKQLTKNTYDTRRYKNGERPGSYKKHDYVTGKLEVGSMPEDVEGDMDELLSELMEIPEGKILISAAYFHVQFENIHPFSDGNGRTGRLLMNYLMVLHNHPPIIIFEEDRKDYYDALEQWDSQQDLQPMIDFLKVEAVKTWRRELNRLIK